ncbi:MAG: M4 family metallopeptidase [Mycobacteriaceae bacterium]|nr:M4 family metallopeptidase [Mycobacteriaceae bacterium]
MRPPARVRRLAAGEIAATGPKRTVCDAHSTERLPGDAVRREGEPAGGDAAVNEAYDGLGATYTFYREAFHRNSIDGRGLPLDATVHYGSSYDNAFWNGDRMVFGDGDGDVFQRFTLSVSVIGHELTHGVTQYSANLDYRGQSGALNEHVSDVFGALVEQFRLGQSADRATWLIGAGLFTPKIKGTALRSMKQPGDAYDDPVLGKDPQPATMSGYVATDDDMGGVHLNCGIPNHAFYLAASELGGYAWERAGRIWYRTLTDAKLPSDVNFAGFAAATARTAADIYGQGSAEHNAVQAAWRRVEVTPNGAARA